MLDYKSLCASVTICATMIDAKLDFYILTTCGLKSRTKPEVSPSVDSHMSDARTVRIW